MVKKFSYDDSTIVDTPGRKVHGYSFDGVDIFKGVPYAKAKRFQEPEEVEHWKGVRETTSYVFALDFPYHYINPAWHCSDIPFFMGNVEKIESANIPGVSERLEQQMLGALVRFAYTGSPFTEELLWPPCKRGDAITMVFDEKSEARSCFDDELIELFKKSAKPLTLKEIMDGDIQH